MPFPAFFATRDFLIAAIDTAWPDVQEKLTDAPTEQPATPYSVMSCVIPSSFGPGSNSVQRTYQWDVAYVFKPGPTDTEPPDVIKITKAGAFVDEVQVANVGNYGYLPIAVMVITQTPPDLLEKGLASVIIRWQVQVNEDHHV